MRCVAALLAAAGGLPLACAPSTSPADEPPPVVQVPRAAAPPPEPPERTTNVAGLDPGPLAVTGADPSRGAADALVTLVQFGDLTDPFIARAAPVLTSIERRWSPNDLRTVWKHYPPSSQPAARPAALAAIAVHRSGGSRAFWSFHAAAVGGWNDHSMARYESWAATAGVSVDDFRARLVDPSTARKVDSDVALADHAGAVSGTLFVNGVECSPRTHCTWIEGVGARHVSSVVEAEMIKAHAALAAGAPRAGLSARLTRFDLERASSSNAADAGAP
jgi:protein-disulfide isomerase